jgi:DNA-binding IclR family transcriptional regulator
MVQLYWLTIRQYRTQVTPGQHDQRFEGGSIVKTQAKPGIQVIARAAAILRSLEGASGGLSLGEIAQRTGLARSTVQRIVDELAAQQMLVAVTPRARVQLGPALVRLAASVRVDTERTLRPLLEELSRSTEETVDLSILQGRSAVFLDQIAGTHRLRAVSAIGESFPLHCTANGKALLNFLPADSLDALLGSQLQTHTRRTLTEPAAIRRAMVQVDKTGLAWDDEEHSEGICAVGTAFADPLGRAFAVSIPVPTVRFRRKRAQLGKALLQTRTQIIALLSTGGR